MQYGLNSEILEIVDKKIEKQIDFLKNFILPLDDGIEGNNDISLLKTTYSANINPQKYFSEVNNRVSSLLQYARNKSLKPVFLTITAPGVYHPTSKRFNGFTPKQTALFLSQMWAKFLRLKIFNKIKKQTGENMIFFRTVEPHKSGVPHFHVMLFIPSNYIIPLKKIFLEYFNSNDFLQVRYKYAFSGVDGGAVAYIMKYINKTFKHAQSGKMSLEAYWCAYWGIRRFYTSRQLVPLKIYRKIIYIEKFRDMLKTTESYRFGKIQSLFNYDEILEIFFDFDECDWVERIVYSRNKNFDVFKSSKVAKNIPSAKKFPKIFDFYINNTKYIYNNGKLLFLNDKLPFSKMSNLQLFKEYQYLYNNIDVVNPLRYGVARNELISRGIIPGSIEKISSFSPFIFFPIL